MQTKLSILAFLGLFGSAYTSPVDTADAADAAATSKLIYYNSHTCKGTQGFSTLNFNFVGRCYDLDFAANSFKVTNFPKGCFVSCYNKRGCGNLDYQLVGGAEKGFCYGADGITRSVRLECRPN